MPSPFHLPAVPVIILYIASFFLHFSLTKTILRQYCHETLPFEGTDSKLNFGSRLHFHVTKSSSHPCVTRFDQSQWFLHESFADIKYHCHHINTSLVDAWWFSVLSYTSHKNTPYTDLLASKQMHCLLLKIIKGRRGPLDVKMSSSKYPSNHFYLPYLFYSIHNPLDFSYTPFRIHSLR